LTRLRLNRTHAGLRFQVRWQGVSKVAILQSMKVIRRFGVAAFAALVWLTAGRYGKCLAQARPVLSMATGSDPNGA